MKTIIKLSLLSLVLTASTSIFATQFCAPEVYLHYGNLSIPNDWHKVRSQIMTNDPVVMRNPNLKLTFYSATYNDSDAPNKQISCSYFSDDSNNFVVIGTNQSGYPAPIQQDTKWKPLGNTDGMVCGFPQGDATITDCPWG